MPLWNQDALSYGLRCLVAILPFYVPYVLNPVGGVLSPDENFYIVTGLLWAMIAIALMTQVTLGSMTKRVIDLSAGLLVGATLGMAMNWTSFVAGKLIVAAAVLMAYPILDFAILPPGLGFGKLMAVGYVIVVFSCFCESTDAKAILWFWLSVIIGYLAGGVSCLVVWTFVVPCYASDKVVEELRNGVKALMTLHDHTWTEWQELNNAAGDEPDRDAKAERLAAQETESVKAREAVASSVYVLQTHLDQAEWEVPFIKMNGRLTYIPCYVHSLICILSKAFGLKPSEPEPGMPNRFTNEALKPFLTSFFQMSRAVWAHHLALRQSVGIDMTEVAALRRSYPPGFLDALRLSMKCFLQDLNDAVPDLNDGGGISMAKEIPEINLNVFASNVEVWIEIAQRGHEQAVRHSLFGGGGSQSMGSEGDRERSSPKEIGSDIKSFNLFLHWTAAHHTALLLCAEGARLREEFHKLFRIQPEESKSELATDSVEETETKSTANAEEIPKITIHIQVDNVEEADAEKEDKGWSRCLSWLSWSTLTANLTLYTAIQSGVRLTILCMALLCPLLILSSDIVYHAHHGMSFYYGIFWTGITLIVLHSSLLGTASSTGVQRAVGTIVGGSLALGVGWSNDPAVIIIVGLVVFGIGGYFGVVLVKSDYGSRLLLVTFFLIIGDYYKGSGPLFTTYVSRMCAVLAGVLLTYLGSILLFPRSATSRVLGELNKMHCAARDLLCNAWMASGLVPSPEEGGEDSSVIEDALSSHLAFNSSYKAFKAYKIIADDESYVGTLWGKRILVPSWLVLRSLPTYLPEEELLEVSKAIGTLRQGIIAFSLSFTEAFDKETAEIILGRYPKGLIEAIKVLSESFIEDVIRSLPDEHGHFHGEKQEVPPFNLTRLTQCVRVLEHISESQYMKIHSRDMGDPQPHDEDPLLIRLGLTVDDPSSNPWLSEDSFPSWKDSQGVSLIPKLDLTMILLPQTKVGFLNLMRWVMARLALSDFCEAAEKLRKAVNELLAKL